MQPIRYLCAALAALTLMSLTACIVVPVGEGRGGGHEQERRDRNDDGREHRRDLGISQREHLGLGPTCCQRSDPLNDAPRIRPAIFVPGAAAAVILPIWA